MFCMTLLRVNVQVLDCFFQVATANKELVFDEVPKGFWLPGNVIRYGRLRQEQSSR